MSKKQRILRNTALALLVLYIGYKGVYKMKELMDELCFDNIEDDYYD